MAVDPKQIEAVLDGVLDPASGQGLVAAGIARAVAVDGSAARFVMDISGFDAKAMEPLRQAAEAAVRQLDGIETVSAVMTAETEPAPPPNLKFGGHGKPQPKGPQKIAGVDHVIAIASGKGGVGKSTLTANLAAALAAEGRKVGLLDADVYGPSQPRMMGIRGRPAATPDGKHILPLKNHGVVTMSMGFMVREDEPIVWRGPMLMGALQQLIDNVAWGELDILLIDLPPGTGDVQLSLSQKAEVDGAIIISTPQDVALHDARKGIGMFQKTGIRVLGLIENMSTHVCSNCGHEEHVFGHGGVSEESARLNVPLLAEIPLHIDVRLAGDAGTPIVVSHPKSAAAGAFRQVAKDLVVKGLA